MQMPGRQILVVWYDIHDVINDRGFAMHYRVISNTVSHLEVF